MLATAACENANVKPIAAATGKGQCPESAVCWQGSGGALTEESDCSTCSSEDTHCTLVVAVCASIASSAIFLATTLLSHSQAFFQSHDTASLFPRLLFLSTNTHVSKAFCTALTNNPTPAEVTATFDPTASEGWGINTAASAGEGMKNLLDIGCSCPDALVDRSGGSKGLVEDAMVCLMLCLSRLYDFIADCFNGE
jgi:hypothetical protein